LNGIGTTSEEDRTIKTLVMFLLNYYLLIILGGIIVIIVVRFVYKTVRPSTKDEAREMATDLTNVYDSITGLPRNITDINHNIFFEENEKAVRRVVEEESLH
jgi:hypothetical protein